MPGGGGAIRGIGEKFAANPVTGTGAMTVPLALSPGRADFGPRLSLAYDSGAGNGLFGLGWSLSLPAITRKTDKGLPRYDDAADSDVFLLSGAEDLVPVLVPNAGGDWGPEDPPPLRRVDALEYRIRRYRPRIEGLFARIERWTCLTDAADSFWRSITRDNITSWYGRSPESRIADPADARRIFSWLINESHDDKGNLVVYRYELEDGSGIDPTRANERNRGRGLRPVQTCLKRVLYGNRAPFFPEPQPGKPWPVPPGIGDEDTRAHWHFEAVLDYDEDHLSVVAPDAAEPAGEQLQYVTVSASAGRPWTVRPDPFSSYRAGFEVRTYRRCHRVLMFHHFPAVAADAARGIATTDGYDGPVRSTDFTYGPTADPDTAQAPVYSQIVAVTQYGFSRQGGRCFRRSLPPVEFEYSQPVIDATLHTVAAETMENIPCGLDGNAWRWVDLDGEGLSGLLTEQAGEWLYKHNESALPAPAGPDGIEPPATARFGPLEVVSPRPVTTLAGGHAQFMDLAGDGLPDVVLMSGPVRGFFERTGDRRWEPFRAFSAWPNVDLRDPNLRFLDLDGDGLADILITEDEAFCWHRSLGEDGFAAAEFVRKPLDEERGPALVFADAEQSIHLADFSGDGLADLVRIRNGEVCYWPNLGYGRFGAKVSMDHSPQFDLPDLFDQKRIRLADVDGSGTTDILYLHGDGVRVYYNQSGNSWSRPHPLPIFPRVDNLAAIEVVDLLGTGTACLVWSSPLAGDSGRQMRYVDLMGGRKPHLLLKSVNNLGAETHIEYAPSTKFYLADRQAGRPWLTRLPFPVQVVERVVTYDHISRNRFVTSYAYHHGHFDGVEREFRGFGMVTQCDTGVLGALGAHGPLPACANEEAASTVPPVLTKTWFHTGAWFDGERVSRQFEDEYYEEGNAGPGEARPSPAQPRAMCLPDVVLPATLCRPDGSRVPFAASADEMREACRTLKGSVLRQEIYALDTAPDGSPSEASVRPYSVVESNFTVECLQPQAGNRHAVFFCHPRESVTFHYERALYPVAGTLRADPRVAHTLTLAVDRFGDVLQSASIVYGRRFDDPAPVLTAADRCEQKRLFITSTENDFTNPVLADDAHRLPLPAESRSYEILNLAPAAGRPEITNLFRFGELAAGLAAAGDGAHDLPYTGVAAASGNAPCRRLIECARTLYRKNDLDGLLSLRGLQSLALPGESFKLAFTPALLDGVFQRANPDRTVEPLLADPAFVLGRGGGEGGGYVDLDRDGRWWIRSGRSFLSPDPADNATAELAVARAHFFLPQRHRGPFHTEPYPTETTVTYDAFDLLVQVTRDALGNCVTAGERDAAGNLSASSIDYRVLQPRLVMDPNRNRTAVAFDALGLVVGTAVMGKPEEALGDILDDTFVADPTPAGIDPFLSDPRGPAAIALLGTATTRIVYDLDRFRSTRALYRDDPEKWQPAFAATIARETHCSALDPGARTELQVSAGYSDGFGREIQSKVQAEPERKAGGADRPRWIGSGWTIFNNKGKPVRQYEPFFSDTFEFEFGVETGVSPVLFYDPMARVVATLHPNGTFHKVVFDPWRQATWDANDTVGLDPRTDPDVAGYMAGYFIAQPADWKTWLQRRLADPSSPPADTRGTAPEPDAAVRTLAHADTPAMALLDALGRTFLAVADNGPDECASPRKFATRVRYDIENNQREIFDALGRLVLRCDYDLLGRRIHQASMEAGERWTLNDAAGQPLLAWDSRGHRFRTSYDQLRRPLGAFLLEGAGPEQMIGGTVYGETQPAPETGNLRGKAWRTFDQAGVVTHGEYDFKGNLLRGSRQLAVEYQSTLDWLGDVALEPDVYASSATYDALNRPTTRTTPDASVIRSTFNEANLLESIEANLRGDSAATSFVGGIDYDAKGRRTRIDYGNGARSDYSYDPDTFRLAALRTDRMVPPDKANPGKLQNLAYTYDPAGNITHIRDDAQQTVFFDGRIVEPGNDYIYDAVNRLVEATGREHLGQVLGRPNAPTPPDAVIGLPAGLPGDGNAMGVYIERYVYDSAGNFLSLQHRGSDPANPGWTRLYSYAEPSVLEPGKKSNRLSSIQVGNASETCRYDGNEGVHGNVTRMAHLPLMRWDFHDRLQATAQQVVTDGVPETTWYVYDSGGQRVRMVTEGAVTAADKAAGKTPIRLQEQIYLGGFEIHRKYRPSDGRKILERETLHIIDDSQLLALVETENPVVPSAAPNPAASLIRFQFGNHLGSAALELNELAQVISYEEYTPYGSTSYQAVRAGLDTNPKRYRYTGKERDEESGLYYYGARYYAPWLGRWTSCDPIGIDDGPNVYAYVSGNPIGKRDKTGCLGGEGPTASPPTSILILGPWTGGGSIDLKFRNIPLALRGYLAGTNVGSLPDFKTFAAGRSLVEKYQAHISKVMQGGYRNVSAVYISEVGVTEESNAFTFREMSTVRRFTDAVSHQVDVFRRIEGERPGESIYTVQRAGSDTQIPLGSGFGAAQSMSAARAVVGAGKQIAKGLIPGADVYDAVKEAGSGSVRTGLSTMVRYTGSVVQQGVQAVRQYGGQALAAGSASAVAAAGAAKAAFGATSLSAIAASGTGAVAVSAGAVALAGAGGVAVGRGLDLGLKISDTTSAVGDSVYTSLRQRGVNDTVSFVAGGVASLGAVAAALTPLGMTYLAGKRIGFW